MATKPVLTNPHPAHGEEVNGCRSPPLKKTHILVYFEWSKIPCGTGATEGMTTDSATAQVGRHVAYIQVSHRSK